jgi:hypothetical protein
MRLMDHVTLNFGNSMSTAAVFLDIEKCFDTYWHPGLLYKLSELYFSSSISIHINFEFRLKMKCPPAGSTIRGPYPVQFIYK